MSNYNLIENGNELIIEIKKSIDEDFIYPKEDKLSSFKTIIIDFNDVSKINSCGIREWIGFLSQIAGKTIIYRNCPKIIVDQMNIVHGFLNDKTIVESIYLPYYCSDCDKEDSKLFRLEDLIKDGEVKVFDSLCKSCNKAMEFDEIPRQYFSFIFKNRK